MEEFLWWIESTSINTESWEISEIAIQKVRENIKKAKQVAQQIKTSWKTNNQIANFLIFLLWELKSEEIISNIYKMFFIKTENWKKTFIKKVNNILLIGFFAPFYRIEIEKHKIDSLFKDIFNSWKLITVDYYCNYLKKLSIKYHDKIAIPKKTVINFIISILSNFKILTPEELNNENYSKTYNNIEKKLYWINKKV